MAVPHWALIAGGMLALLVPLVSCPEARAASIASAETEAGEAAAREVLERCARLAVARLSRAGGIAAHPRLRITMPPALAEAERIVRRLGGKKETEAFLAAMNEAAETLAGKSGPLLREAIADTALPAAGPGTLCDALRQQQGAQLGARLQPLARELIDGALIDRAYRRLVKQAGRYGYLRGDAPSLDQYLAAQTVRALLDTMTEMENHPASQLVGRVETARLSGML